MATFDVPNRYLALSPVIVTSPTPRCGTTLVQRLLTGSRNAFVYGEEVGHQIRTITVWLMGLVRQFEQVRHFVDADFARALAGALTDWRPGLTAPTDVMLRAWIETYYQLPYALAEFSRSVDRPVWGFKGPGYDRDTLKAFLFMLPNARVVYVVRNLGDVLKSAKARRFVTDEDQTAGFCAEWAKNIREMIDLAADSRVLIIKYEELLALRTARLASLEAFTGARDLDPRTFDLKINTFEGEEANGHSPSQYIEPHELTEAERRIVMAKAGPVLTHLYPDPFQAAA